MFSPASKNNALVGQLRRMVREAPGADTKIGKAVSSQVDSFLRQAPEVGFPDVCMTPTPAGPVPIPYPNISTSKSTGNAHSVAGRLGDLDFGKLAEGLKSASPDALLAEFLKLNLADPNNDPAVHDLLQSLVDGLPRAMGAGVAKGTEAARGAKELGEQVAADPRLGVAVEVGQAVATVAASVATFGAGAGLAAVAVAGRELGEAVPATMKRALTHLQNAGLSLPTAGLR